MTSIFLFFLFFLPLAASVRQDYKLKDYQVGRYFAQSTDGPITKELAKLPTVVHTTQMVLNHVSRVEDAIRASLKTGMTPPADAPVRPCNHKNKDFGESARRSMLARGWPAPDFSCVTDVMGTTLKLDTPPSYSADDLYEAVFNSGKVLKERIRAITYSAIHNFSNPDFSWDYKLETPSQKCTLHPSIAFRFGDTWTMGYLFTNEAKNARLPNFGRQTVSEFPYIVDGRLAGPQTMCLPFRPKNGSEHIIRNDTTTMIASFRGTRNPSFIARLFIEDNPAVLRSLDQTDLFVQQADDALTPSNIAILVLPLLLNLVPIALLANVDTVSMLLYTLMSDVLTVFPLGIKGAELINIGLQRDRSAFVRMTGALNGSQAEAAAAELHVAECRAHDAVLPAGITFLVLSLVFLVGGVAAEFIAKEYSKNQRQRFLEELKMAESSLSSKGSSEPSSWSWKGAVLSTYTSLPRAQPNGAVGSPFRTASFSTFYEEKNTDKKA